MVDVPPFDLNPLHEWAAVRVKLPVSFVVLDHVERVQVGLAVRAGLDLERPAFYLVSAFRIAEQTDISHNLTNLCKLNRAFNRYLSIWVVDVLAFY